MAKLRTAMDTAFWDVDVATPRRLEGAAKAVPGEAFPMDACRASPAFRFHQVSLMSCAFPLGLLPSYSPPLSPSSKDLGSFSLQSIFLRTPFPNWWFGLMGQFRPRKLVSSLKTEFSNKEEDAWFPRFNNVAKHFVDKSRSSLAFCAQYAPAEWTYVKFTTELHRDTDDNCKKITFSHKIPDHDIKLEAAWPQLFIDSKGQYWEVPESVSLDLSSDVAGSGLQYRVGLHNNRGHPVADNAPSSDAPDSLMPGLCAKAAFSYETRWEFWRLEETMKDLVAKTNKGVFWQPAYDKRLKEPHSAISGIIGGAFSAWFGGASSVVESESRDSISVNSRKRSPVSADLFGSVCYTYQLGGFHKFFCDLTRLDARLDIPSASGLAKTVFGKSSDRADNSASSPRLNLIFHQQVLGPVAVRLDARVLLGSSSIKKGSHVEDVLYTLSYNFRVLDSGKIVFWYSPKRKEGMVEFRIHDF